MSGGLPVIECKVDDCAKSVRTAGLCSMHYARLRRHGSVDVRYPERQTLAERFWPKVDRNGPGGCWLFTGHRANGYGTIYVRRDVARSQTKYAHRVAYELLVGPIPAGLTLDHLCRVPSCVNPAHLEPVTIAENVRRGNGPSARKGRQTTCDNGHPFDEANTYRDPSTGWRRCRTCQAEWQRRHPRQRSVTS